MSDKEPFDIMDELAPLTKFEGGDYPFLRPDIDDISMVMLATSLIDRVLRLVLLAGFRSSAISNKLIKKIFESDGPLSTFAGRIDVCRALGLISYDIQNDIAIMKSIRNEFAHSFAPKQLADYPEINSLKVRTTQEIRDDKAYRLKFKQSCVGIVGNLFNRALFETAKDRFVAKNTEGVRREFDSLREEASKL